MTWVRIGGFFAEGGTGFDGFFLERGGLAGWTSSVAVRRDETPRQNSHGSIDSPGFRSARTLGLSGKCHASSAERLNYYADRLNSVLAGGEKGRVLVQDAGRTLWGEARLAAAPSFEIETPGSVASWDLQLWFPDPRKYGETQLFPPKGEPGSNSIVTYHYGNFEASPVITVTGAGQGYTINGPTGYYIVTKPLAIGHPHVIDMRTGRLTVDGVTIFGGVLQADTWTIPAAGEILQTIVPASGTATMRISVTSTYV